MAESRRSEILALRQESKTYKEISELLGCSTATVAYHCGPGQRQKAIDKKKTNRDLLRQRMQEVKSSTPCTDCGISYPHYVMDFDHRPGEDKLFNLSDVGNRLCSKASMEAEMAKCDVVCANCHRVRTYERLRTAVGGS